MKRGRTDSKMVAVLVQKEQEAAAQAETLTKAAKMAEENAARVVTDAKYQAKELIQASKPQPLEIQITYRLGNLVIHQDTPVFCALSLGGLLLVKMHSFRATHPNLSSLPTELIQRFVFVRKKFVVGFSPGAAESTEHKRIGHHARQN